MRRLFVRSVLVFLLCLMGWGVGLLWYVRTLPQPPINAQITHTDGAIVLTGGTGRLKVALELLSSHKTERLFITGVYRGVDVSELLRLSKQAPAELSCCITLDYEANDTLENAQQSARWVRKMGLKSIRLVTSDYHIRRSMLEFRMTMPDMVIEPHPVTPAHLNMTDWWQSKTLLQLMAIEYTKYLIVTVRYGLYLAGLEPAALNTKTAEPE